MNSYERKRRICKVIVLVLGILSINNIILTIRNYSYAYFHKTVKSDIKLKITTLDEMPVKGEIATKVIKDTLGATGGIIGVTKSNSKVITESSNIREYRYSGPDINNYVYFNCEDGKRQNADSCDVWRIIGVFKDEEGYEHLKIVKNEILSGIFPETFEVNSTIYKIGSGNYAYWNYITGTDSDKNNWATGGLQYWLNAGSNKETKSAIDGYMSYLSKNAKTMIAEAKYYLGNVVSETDTTINSYIHERGNKSCNDSCSGGDVWMGNSATWNGKISLLYPSDYGYSLSNSYWNTYMQGYKDGSTTSWLHNNANHNSDEWLLSPYYWSSYSVLSWASSSSVNISYNYWGRAVRPCLYLKSEVKIIEGDGTSESPYALEI